MKVLITGGAGFIGSNLSRMLLDSAGFDEVRVLDDLSTGSLENLDGLDVKFVQGSILDQEILATVVDGIDSIVHLGAIPSVPRSIANPRASHDANATGTLNVLEAARANGVSQVILASSSSVYGANPKLPKFEDDFTRPMSPYAVSKLAAESYALAYRSSYGLKTLAFRFFNVYGPGQSAGHAYAAVIPKFIAAALSDEPLEINGDGTQSRDFTYVDTVCEVIRKAILSETSSESPINLAFNTNTSLLTLINDLETLMGTELKQVFKPTRVGDVRASQADSSRLYSLFPDLTPVDLTTGLKKTLDWYRLSKAGA